VGLDLAIDLGAIPLSIDHLQFTDLTRLSRWLSQQQAVRTARRQLYVTSVWARESIEKTIVESAHPPTALTPIHSHASILQAHAHIQLAVVPAAAEAPRCA
jgi:hypothetical protein